MAADSAFHSLKSGPKLALLALAQPAVVLVHVAGCRTLDVSSPASPPDPAPLSPVAASPCRYDYQVDPQSPEQKFLDAVRNPREQRWV